MTNDTYVQRAERCFSLLAGNRRRWRPAMERAMWLWLFLAAGAPA